jgi:hypothetical protein
LPQHVSPDVVGNTADVVGAAGVVASSDVVGGTADVSGAAGVVVSSRAAVLETPVRALPLEQV